MMMIIIMMMAFSSLARMFGEGRSFPACAFFSFFVEISSRTSISLFRPGSVQIGSERIKNG